MHVRRKKLTIIIIRHVSEKNWNFIRGKNKIIVQRRFTAQNEYNKSRQTRKRRACINTAMWVGNIWRWIYGDHVLISIRIINTYYILYNTLRGTPVNDVFQKIITTGSTYRRRILLGPFLAHEKKKINHKNWKINMTIKNFAPIDLKLCGICVKRDITQKQSIRQLFC